MENTCAGAVQPLAEGVTVMVPVMLVWVVLVVTKEGMLPVPLVPRPIAALLLFQSNEVLETDPLKFRSPVGWPAQITWLAGTVTSGAGFTVMVKPAVWPGQY